MKNIPVAQLQIALLAEKLLSLVEGVVAFDCGNFLSKSGIIRDRNLPLCFIRIISCWYSKLYSVVRWNSVYSSEYKMLAAVRQGSIWSPILFNIYVNNLIEELKSSGYGCFIGRTFVGCIMYADDLLLSSPSVNGMQSMLDICSVYGGSHIYGGSRDI
jgi:Reverse transcriptase (RNA-dependent DNA polymerase)